MARPSFMYRLGIGLALAKGLVTRVVPDDQVAAEAQASARRIAEGAPLAARWHKRFARRLADPRPIGAEESDHLKMQPRQAP